MIKKFPNNKQSIGKLIPIAPLKLLLHDYIICIKMLNYLKRNSNFFFFVKEYKKSFEIFIRHGGLFTLKGFGKWPF